MSTSIRGIRNSANITRKLRPHIELAAKDGTRLLARTLTFRMEHHPGSDWQVVSGKVSCSKERSRLRGWSETFNYVDLDDVNISPALQEQIDELVEWVRRDSRDCPPSR